jgi:hypothetical protein
MTQLCCPRCWLRFTSAAAAYLSECPECGGSLQLSSLEGIVGFRIFRFEDVPRSLPQAVAGSIPVPEVPTNPGGSRRGVSRAEHGRVWRMGDERDGERP